MKTHQRIVDQNQWLKPPEGYDLVDVVVHGAYLVISYELRTGDEIHGCDIALNQDGREVLRHTYTEAKYKGLEPADKPIKSAKQPWYSKFWSELIGGTNE